jgi:glycosyltransferase involved in cell wall biosynthesis
MDQHRFRRKVFEFCRRTSDDNKLAHVYRSADITLLPSLAENFPYVAIESLACEIPLISFAVGGMPEIIGEDERGIVCATIDAKEMGRGLLRLVENPRVRDAMGSAGRKWVKENCGMNKYLSDTVSVYQRLLER